MNENFNDFNNSENNQNEILMSESEKKAHKTIFSKLCFAILFYLVFVNGLSIVATFVINYIDPALLENYNFFMIFSSVIQYAIGFPLLVMILRKIPASAPQKSALGTKGFLK